MIPSLLLISSGKTRCVILTQKKNIKIGMQKNSDIVVNHPYFTNHVEVLGRDSIPCELQRKAKTSFILTFYKFTVDELCVRYVQLRTLFYIILILCIGAVFVISFLAGHRDQSNVQDWTPIFLPADGIYGFCRQDRTHGEGIHFRFEAKTSQSYRLLFLPGGKGDGTSIKLSLNGFKTDSSLPLPDGWGNRTSFILPSALLKTGENSIIISPENHLNDQLLWGISEVRAVPLGRSNSTIRRTISQTPEEVLNALNDQGLQGADLASYYKTVRTWDTSVISKDAPISRNRIIAEIEQRMREILHQVAFKVRSNQLLDDQSKNRQILDETADWLPENWVEGWEIYREICQ